MTAAITLPGRAEPLEVTRPSWAAAKAALIPAAPDPTTTMSASRCHCGSAAGR